MIQYLDTTVDGVSRLYQTHDTGQIAGGFNLNVATVNLDDFGLASGANLKSVVIGLDVELDTGTVPSLTVVGALNTGCAPLTVASLKQFSESWRDLTYDHYYSTVSADDDGDGTVDEDARDGIDNDHDGKKDEDTPDTIGKWGCYLTATAMIVNYHAQQQGRPFATGLESLSVDDESDTSPTEAELFEVFHPVDGTYQVTVVGTGLGVYRLNIFGYDQVGNPTVQTLFAITDVGVVARYSIVFSQTEGVPASGVSHLISISNVLDEVRISRRLGLIDDQGIANSLAQKLEAANAAAGRNGPVANNILRAFINEVSAQSGKHVTPEVANLLIADANSLLH